MHEYVGTSDHAGDYLAQSFQEEIEIIQQL
jgi:hypothetical protein